MIKLIATDLDGTFFRDDKSFSEEFYDVFEELKKRNIYFTIASGNQYELIRDRFERIKDDAIFVAENGTKIVYKDNILCTNTLKKEHVKLILKLLEPYFHQIMVAMCGKTHAYVLKKFQSHEEWYRMFSRNYQYVDSFDDIEDDVLKFSIADFEEHPDYYVNIIKEHLPDDLQIVTTGNCWFDIFDINVNKGTAMKFLQDYFNIDRSECMSFGDMMNDYQLLESCEESYAMENAVDEIKAIAKHIAPSNQDDGVIQVIKQMLKK